MKVGNDEALKKLFLIEKEIKRRRENNKLADYNTTKIHKKQMQFHKCKKRNKWVFGGNRSGKTQCGAVEAVWLARGIHPFRENKKNCDGWVVSLSQQVQRDVAQSKVLYYLNPDWIVDIVMLNGRKDSAQNGVIDYILINNVFGGVSKIGFKTCDQGREKFQGTSLDWVWFDEEPPFDIYLECRMRVLDREGSIFGTMTPLKGLTWVYDKIYLNEGGDDEVWCIEMEWADNPYLSKAEIDSLTKSLSADELESRRFGKFTASGGLVYSEFEPNVHIIEPFSVPHDWYDNISIDPGLHNPLSAHWYAVDFDGNIYVIAEHYEAGQPIEYHANKIIEKCQNLGWHTGFDGKYGALIDSAANQKTLASSKSVSELFLEYGINVNPNVNKDLFSGISRVKSYLKNAKGEARLFIFSTCVNMIREIKGYWWGKADAPIKKDDHAMDELRYYIMSRPEAPLQTGPPLTMIQKHKYKLIAQHRRSINRRF
ncbi:MAG: terminase family protein [Clostridia bacterium]|nr:terminase family protein [Clostridia bacterium]